MRYNLFSALNLYVYYSYNKSQQYVCTISQLYFGKQLYMFRTDLLSIIRSLLILYNTASGTCHTSYVDCLLARSGVCPKHVQ